MVCVVARSRMVSHLFRHRPRGPRNMPRAFAWGSLRADLAAGCHSASPGRLGRSPSRVRSPICNGRSLVSARGPSRTAPWRRACLQLSQPDLYTRARLSCAGSDRSAASAGRALPGAALQQDPRSAPIRWISIHLRRGSCVGSLLSGEQLAGNSGLGFLGGTASPTPSSTRQSTGARRRPTSNRRDALSRPWIEPRRRSAPVGSSKDTSPRTTPRSKAAAAERCLRRADSCAGPRRSRPCRAARVQGASRQRCPRHQRDRVRGPSGAALAGARIKRDARAGSE